MSMYFNLYVFQSVSLRAISILIKVLHMDSIISMVSFVLRQLSTIRNWAVTFGTEDCPGLVASIKLRQVPQSRAPTSEISYGDNPHDSWLTTRSCDNVLLRKWSHGDTYHDRGGSRNNIILVSRLGRVLALVRHWLGGDEEPRQTLNASALSSVGISHYLRFWAAIRLRDSILNQVLGVEYASITHYGHTTWWMMLKVRMCILYATSKNVYASSTSYYRFANFGPHLFHRTLCQFRGLIASHRYLISTND